MLSLIHILHDNTAHVHSHIVFNSVSFVDGKKYRYEKGDWAKYIQPITNKLCQDVYKRQHQMIRDMQFPLQFLMELML